MRIRRETVVVSGAAGGAGSATANATTDNVVSGRVLAVYLAYTDTPPSTTDVTIEEAGKSPALPVLSVSDANSDGWFYPDVATVNSDVAPVYVDDHLEVTIAGANNGDGVTATIVWCVD